MNKIDAETRTRVMIHLAIHVLKCPWVEEKEHEDYKNTFVGFAPHSNGSTPIMIPEYWDPFYSLAANEDIVYRIRNIYMDKIAGYWTCRVKTSTEKEFISYRHKSRLYAVCMAAAIATGFEVPA